MKKIIGWIFIILGTSGLIKSIPALIEYSQFTKEANSEGFYFGRLPSDFGISFFSFIFLISGIFLIRRKKNG